MSLVKHLGAVDGTIPIKNQLEGWLWLQCNFSPSLFVYWRNLKWITKGSGYILSSTSSQTLAVYPSNSNLVDLCPNHWCNNSKGIFYLAGNFFFFDFSMIFPVNHVYFVHCVVMLLHSSPFLLIKPWKTLCEKDKYVLNLWT